MAAMNPSRGSAWVRSFVFAVGGILFIGAALAGFGLAGVGACAYVPPAQRQHPIGPYLVVGAPPLITFFVLGYFALGFGSKVSRVIAFGAAVAITLVVAVASVAYLEPYCGL
jgi:hypothetical protein